MCLNSGQDVVIYTFYLLCMCVGTGATGKPWGSEETSGSWCFPSLASSGGLSSGLVAGASTS